MNKGGRPPARISWKQVEALCEIQCTQSEICSVIGVCEDTLDKHCKAEHGISFSAFFKQKREGGHSSLRRSQWLMAKKNPTMAIWLGKQYLGQTDKQELKAENKITIEQDESQL